MKAFVLFLVLSVGVGLQLPEIRKSYVGANTSEAEATKFVELLSNIDATTPTLKAYKGCSLAFKAKHSNYPPDKFAYMKQGAELIEAAVAAEPRNIEIRVIRLSVQENVPLIVGYRKNKDEDKAFILKNYKAASNEIKPFIRNFVNQSASFTAAERSKLK